MKAQRISVHSHKDQRGFTIIELMVAVAIILLIMVAAFSMFEGSVLNSDLAQAVVDTNENVRATMAFLVRDFIASGAEITVGGIPVPSTFLPGRVLYPITPAPNQGPTINGQQTDRVLTIYDQLALKQLDASQMDVAYKIKGAGSIDPMGQWIILDTSTPPGQLQPNPDTSTLRVSDVLLIKANGGKGTVSALGNVTSLSGPNTINFASGDSLGLNASGATSPLAALSCRNQGQPVGCVDEAVAFKVNLVQYYIDNSGPVPILMRQVNGQAPTQLGLNIENLKINYVLDDGTTSPNPANPTNIRQVVIFLMGRSSHKVTQDQTYYRFPLSCQVATRNLAYMARAR